MNNIKFLFTITIFICLLSLSQSFTVKTNQVVNFNVRGNGKTNVSLGVGYQVGSGACCRGISKESTVGFQGNVGDVLYDSDTKRIITKIYKELNGTTIDLRVYY